MKNRNLIVIMLVIIIAMCGRSIPSAFAEETVDFEKTYVLDDLTSSEDFNILTYPFYESIEPTVKIINVVEYCYSFKESVSQNYGLYLYIYNPNALNILKEDYDYIIDEYGADYIFMTNICNIYFIIK